MQFILSSGWEQGEADLTKRLVQELAGGRSVLWLVTGGSNIPISVDVMAKVADELSPRLTVMPADERYGAVGHEDSNWAQLLAAGFDGKHARLLPVLRNSDSFEAAGAYFAKLAGQAFTDNQVVIAQMGIGNDGHLAGIMPGSTAAAEHTALVTAYDQPPYRRLTLTFPALRKITADYSFAFGETKRQALLTLQTQTLEPAKQPAQILKQLPEAYIYSDQIGEHA